MPHFWGSQSVSDVVIRSVFNKYDKDGSNHLSMDETKHLLADDLGLDENGVRAFQLIMDSDSNYKHNHSAEDDYTVTFEEFKRFVKSPNIATMLNRPSHSTYHLLTSA
eukprot:Awhi_evm1s15346